MKRSITLLILFVAFSFGTLFGQQSDFDERLLAKYTVEEVEAMGAEELAFNTYCIAHAFVVMPFPSEKKGNLTIDGSKNIDDLENINFFDLNIVLKEDQYQYFIISGTDQMLAVKPIFLIKQEL